MSDSRAPAIEESSPVLAPAASTAPAEGVAGEVLATQIEWVVPILGLWAALGMSAALLLRRRGHEFPPAALLGVVMGPLFIPLAHRDLLAHTPAERWIIIDAATRRGGAIDVLVAADLADTAGGVGGAIEQHVGHAYGRLMLGAAIDYESAASGVLSPRARRTAHHLEVSAMMLMPCHPAGRVLVAGPQAEALLEYATRNNYEMVILGPGAQLREPAPDGLVVVRAGAT